MSCTCVRVCTVIIHSDLQYYMYMYTLSAAIIISRQLLSTWVNLRPSSGICAMMSGEEKMGSK